MDKRWQRLTIIAGILIILLFTTAAFSRKSGAEKNKEILQAADGPASECTGCHEMAPEILTWQLSSHSRIACTECHDRQASDYELGAGDRAVTKPIFIAEAISNEVCEKCHSPNRTVSATGDIIIPHDRHSQAGVTCVKCHSGVVHANIAERDLTTGKQAGAAVKWDENMAKQVSTKFYQQPSMWTCINCHKQASVTRKCSACHTSINVLPSHDRPEWGKEHGQTARTNIGDCTKCHVTPDSSGQRNPIPNSNAVAFARSQEFCYSCHLKRPGSHGEAMVPIHPERVAAQGAEACLTCHEREQPKPGIHVPGTYCNQCHWNSEKENDPK